jgi:hypothetical protein
VKLFVNCHASRSDPASRACAGLLLSAVLVAAALPAFAQAVSPIDYGPDSLAAPRLGIAIATVGELADAPELLARPSSQQFVDDTFARIAATTSDVMLRTHSAQRRDALRVGSGAFDRSAAYAALADETKDTLRSVGAGNDKLVAFGILAEQTDYNARVLHDAAVDAQYRSSIGRDAYVDPLVPGLADLRAKLAAVTAQDWDASATAAEAVVGALLGSDVDVPFPRSSAVWLVLLRTRATSADSRRHAAHYWLDIVHFDGKHRTIGGYPNGTLAFDRDAGRLVCEYDREPAVPSLQTIPVPPGLVSTSAQLATSLLQFCSDERTSGLPYHVADADDDRFVADILFRSGVLVGPLLRSAVNPSP